MADQRCNEKSTSDGWHFSLCGKPAKFVVTTPRGVLRLCGIHARRYRNKPDCAVQEA